MNFGAIKKNDIANGKGVRVSLFVSGCRHRCYNCFNKETWDFNYGNKYNENTKEEILSACDYSHIAGLSLLGGEPFEPENQEELINLTKAFKERFLNKDIWCYTGFLFEDILAGKAGDAKTALKLLENIDVLVDGKFIEKLKNPALLFRGSSNQRIIDVKSSLITKKAELLPGKWTRAVGSLDIKEN